MFQGFEKPPLALVPLPDSPPRSRMPQSPAAAASEEARGQQLSFITKGAEAPLADPATHCWYCRNQRQDLSGLGFHRVLRKEKKVPSSHSRFLCPSSVLGAWRYLHEKPLTARMEVPEVAPSGGAQDLYDEEHGQEEGPRAQAVGAPPRSGSWECNKDSAATSLSSRGRCTHQGLGASHPKRPPG